MQSNLVGQYIKEGWGVNVVYNEIVAVYVHKGTLRLIARSPGKILYKCSGLNHTVVDLNSIPAGGLKC